MSKLSRNKGASWEREVAEKLRAIGIPAERCLTETRDGNVGDITTPAPIVVQAKVGKLPPIWKAVAEAREAADGTGKYPIAVVKRNGSRHIPAEELAVMPLDDFLDLLKVLYETVWT